MNEQDLRQALETKARWLDRALGNQSDAVRARVLDVLVHYGIDPDNEFFMIFVAMGQLLALVEESPEQWQAVFEQFGQELNQWQATNLQTLDRLAHQAQSMAELSTSTRRLSGSLTELTQVCLQLMRPLLQSNQTWTSSTNQLQQSILASTQLLQELRSEQSQINQRLDYLEKAILSTQLKLQSRTRDWSVKAIGMVLGGLVLAGIGLLYWQQQGEAERVQWLLEKANRWECQQGIKAPDSPECQSL